MTEHDGRRLPTVLTGFTPSSRPLRLSGYLPRYPCSGKMCAVVAIYFAEITLYKPVSAPGPGSCAIMISTGGA
jgi:hypothetical protein